MTDAVMVKLSHVAVLLTLVNAGILPALLASASEAPTESSQTYEGILVGGGLGLHVSKYTTWRSHIPLDIMPGTVSVRADLVGDDMFGADYWVTFVGPDGEPVTRSPGGSSHQAVTLTWPHIDSAGFGNYQAVVECGLCGTMTYQLTLTTKYAPQGANLTVEDERLFVVPDKTTSTLATLTNTGLTAAPLGIHATSLPEGWLVSFATTGGGPLQPGESLVVQVGIIPPTDTPAGTRVSFDLVASAPSGAVLDTVTLEAAYTEEIARLVSSSNVVVALVDTGINPYHEEFRGQNAGSEHPGYYVSHYPAGAKPLPLTLDAPDYETAKAADADIWANAVGGQLYYVPGTRIIGMICFDNKPCAGLDEGGHGTGTASLVGGTTTGEVPDALIVAVTGDIFRSIRWASSQPWIDVVSMSLGAWLGTCVLGETCGPVYGGTGNPYVPFSPPQGQKVAYESGKRFFAGSSQGWSAGVQTGDVPYTGASGPCPYTFAGSFAGSPWVFSVETYWPWTELPWKTSCTPDVVAQGWDLVAAAQTSYTGYNSFGHASGATPQAAGMYARGIQEGRMLLRSTQEGPLAMPIVEGVPNKLGDAILAVAAPDATLPTMGPLADGVLTTREAEAAYLHSLEQVNTAQSFLRHGTDPRWQDDATLVLPGAEYATEGYGLVTDDARTLLLDVIRGDAAEPLRVKDDAAYAAWFAFRLAFWEAHVEGEIWVF